MGVSHPPVSRRSVGNTSKQPYFQLSACRRSSRARIQSAIQGKCVFTRRIEDCAKPQAPGVSRAALKEVIDALGARQEAQAELAQALRNRVDLSDKVFGAFQEVARVSVQLAEGLESSRKRAGIWLPGDLPMNTGRKWA